MILHLRTREKAILKIHLFLSVVQTRKAEQIPHVQVYSTKMPPPIFGEVKGAGYKSNLMPFTLLAKKRAKTRASSFAVPGGKPHFVWSELMLALGSSLCMETAEVGPQSGFRSRDREGAFPHPEG